MEQDVFSGIPRASEVKDPIETLQNIGAFCIMIRCLEDRYNRGLISGELFEEFFILSAKELLDRKGKEIQINAIEYKNLIATNINIDDEDLCKIKFEVLEDWYIGGFEELE